MTIAAYMQTSKGSKHTYRKLERVRGLGFAKPYISLSFSESETIPLYLIFINLNSSVDCSHEIRDSVLLSWKPKNAQHRYRSQDPMLL